MTSSLPACALCLHVCMSAWSMSACLTCMHGHLSEQSASRRWRWHITQRAPCQPVGHIVLQDALSCYRNSGESALDLHIRRHGHFDQLHFDTRRLCPSDKAEKGTYATLNNSRQGNEQKELDVGLRILPTTAPSISGRVQEVQ